MLVFFLATGQQISLTITAVLATGGIATGAVYFYGREEAHNELDDDYEDEPLEASAPPPDHEPPPLSQPDEPQAIEPD